MFNKTQIIYIFIICCTMLFGKSYTLSPADTISINYFDSSPKFRLEASIFGGGGSEEFDLFKTTKDETVTISPGGGFGGKISFGYCLTPLLNINMEFGTQTSTLSKKLKNAEGSFSRTFLLGTLRYKFPLSGKSSINIAGGAGSYKSGKLDVDGSKVEGGGHNIYKYENASGIHVMGEYEHYLPDLSFLDAVWSLSIGLKYYDIAYKIDSVSSDGVSIPITLLPVEVKNEIKELNGSGVDVIFSIIMHL